MQVISFWVRGLDVLGMMGMGSAVSLSLHLSEDGGIWGFGWTELKTGADGLDLNGPNLIKFGIESKASCTTTDTTRFTHRIVQALRDMRRVCEAAE